MTDPRELIATLMIKHSFATGHGDTLEELLSEFDAQLRDLRARHFELEHLYADTLASREMEQRDAAANDALPPKRCPQPDYCVAQRVCHWNCNAEHGVDAP